MPVSTVKSTWRPISAPWSQVMVLTSRSGKVVKTSKAVSESPDEAGPSARAAGLIGAVSSEGCCVLRVEERDQDRLGDL
jgi:hypothetical protein